MFFRRYDSDNDGRLSFSDFCAAFTPISKEYATLLTSRPDFFAGKARSPQEFFNLDTRDEYRRAWSSHFSTERATECLRMRLHRRAQFQLKDAFAYIDKNANGYLTLDELR